MMKEHCQFNGFSIKIGYSSQSIIFGRVYSRVAESEGGDKLVAAEILH